MDNFGTSLFSGDSLRIICSLSIVMVACSLLVRRSASLIGRIPATGASKYSAWKLDKILKQFSVATVSSVAIFASPFCFTRTANKAFALFLLLTVFMCSTTTAVPSSPPTTNSSMSDDVNKQLSDRISKIEEQLTVELSDRIGKLETQLAVIEKRMNEMNAWSSMLKFMEKLSFSLTKQEFNLTIVVLNVSTPNEAANVIVGMIRPLLATLQNGGTTFVVPEGKPSSTIDEPLSAVPPSETPPPEMPPASSSDSLLEEVSAASGSATCEERVFSFTTEESSSAVPSETEEMQPPGTTFASSSDSRLETLSAASGSSTTAPEATSAEERNVSRILSIQPNNRWNPKDCDSDLRLFEPEMLRVERRETTRGFRIVRAEFAVPRLNNGFFYFEVQIKKLHQEVGHPFHKLNQIYIGFASKEIPLDHQTDGAFIGKHLFFNNLPDIHVDDIVGCAMDLSINETIYTINGQRMKIGNIYVSATEGLYPAVYLYYPGDSVAANFGPEFKYDIFKSI